MGVQKPVCRVASRFLVSILTFASVACSYMAPEVEPLTRWDPQHNGEVRQMMSADRLENVAVLLAFSGGGTRAAAFSYGVLKELDRTVIHTPHGDRSMLAEVDMISSVSGGSFTAAYYGLYGDQIFEGFETRFLRSDVQGSLLKLTLSPSNWGRLASPTYGRADLAAEYYDRILFGNAPLSAMERPGAPQIVINSTDLTTGVRIPFVQEMFDLMCVDIGEYPVSRAVAASSGVPIIFSPIAVQNHAGSCGYRPPDWISEALESDQLTSQKIVARSINGYLDRELRPWLHLVDGGISDNLGLRSFYRALTLTADLSQPSDLLPHLNAQHVLVVLVNANAHPHHEWALERESPPLLEVAGSVSGSQIGLYSDDTILITRNTFERWVEEHSAPARPVTFHFVDVSFNRVEDSSERMFLNNIGTSFVLTDEEVDSLILAGEEILSQSPVFQDFLKVIQGSVQRGPN